tara:strand:+ start:31 stop:1107 length:1077 start_codon:yes stop_codon:yes gene_type:complete
MAENRKKLRPPTKEERLKGLPTSRDEAIEKGITRYFRGDEEYVIRNYGSKTAPQGRDTKAALRKASRGGGSKGARKEYEFLSTPLEARTGDARRRFGRAMVEARQKGLVGDHRYSVARTGNALKIMSPDRQKLYHDRFKKAGIAIGNQAANIDEISEALNYAKVVEEKKLDSALKRLEKLKINGNSNSNGNGKNGNGLNGKNGKSKNGLSISGAGKTRKLDAALNIGANVASGNYAGAAVGAGTIAAAETLKSKAAQKAIAQQIATIAAKRGGKTALKLVPGLDVLISGKETLDYLKQGKLDQAGIAALSGAIGWIPIVGDGASAALDLTNTGIDISRLQIPTKGSKKTSTRRLKIKT